MSNRSFAVRSIIEAARALLIALAIVAAGAASAVEPGAAPTREQVQAATAQVRNDPNLGGTKTGSTLRFKEKTSQDEKPASRTGDFEWLRNFVQWVSETARMLVWVTGALAFALLVVGIRRWVRARALATLPPSAHLPSHVRDLDIRPESLPADIGQAAAALWQQGEHRGALSLLYRGALSCLVHRDAIPIRAASTEGECVQLAAARLDAQRSGFFAGLVGAWQLAVYGGRLPATAQVLDLCSQFNTHLRPAPQHEAAA